MVTVIIPCYKQAHFLKDCIDSVRKQTVKAEIIVVDDGSPDNTLEVAEILGVKCIKQVNKGLSAARNAGIRAATTEYILPLDADDTIEPQYLEKTLQHIKQYDIISTWLQTFGNENKKWGSKILNPTIGVMKSQNRINCCSLFRKSMWEKVGGYDENMKKGFEDWEFWLRCMQSGYTIKIVPEYLFNYRKHNVSMLKEAFERRSEILDYMSKKRSKTGKLIDVVIPFSLTKSKSHNNELRYCLRSIEEHLESYRDIWIVGEAPKWAKNIKVLPHKEYNPKSKNIYDKVKAACKNKDITEDFILFNDDYILTKQTDAPTYPYYISEDELTTQIQRDDQYGRLVNDTVNEIGKGFKFADIHTPILINKEKFLTQPYNRNYPYGLLVKSSYLNHINPKTEDIKDPVLKKPPTEKELIDFENNYNVISLTDNCINATLNQYLLNKFPYDSKYEI